MSAAGSLSTLLLKKRPVAEEAEMAENDHGRQHGCSTPKRFRTEDADRIYLADERRTIGSEDCQGSLQSAASTYAASSTSTTEREEAEKGDLLV